MANNLDEVKKRLYFVYGVIDYEDQEFNIKEYFEKKDNKIKS